MSIQKISCPACNGTDFENDDEGNLICAFCGTLYASPRDEVQCPTCGTLNPPQALLCMQCGRNLGKMCPNCDHVNEPGVDHCHNCGVPLDTIESIFSRQRGSDRAPVLRTEKLVATKREDMIYMKEQQDRLAEEERARQAKIAAQMEASRRQQTRLLTGLFIASGACLLLAIVVAVIISAIGG